MIMHFTNECHASSTNNNQEVPINVYWSKGRGKLKEKKGRVGDKKKNEKKKRKGEEKEG